MEQKCQTSKYVEERTQNVEDKDITINGWRRKISSQEIGIHQRLHSHETQHSSQFDFIELYLKIRVGQWPACGNNMSERNPLKYHKCQDIEPEVEEQMEKWLENKSSQRLVRSREVGPKAQG